MALIAEFPILTDTISVPWNSEFTHAKLDYMEAPALERLAARLIREKPQLQHLRNVKLAYLWKRKGGTSGTRAVLGKCTKTPGLVRTYRDTTFTIWLAADHCRDFALDDRQLEALLFHELMHAAIEEVENEKTGEITEQPTIVGHDLEMFTAEVEEYGLWRSELKRAQDTFAQAAMPGFDVVAFGVGV